MGNTYALSTKSLKRLSGVHSDLVRVVVRAIQITEVDFAVLEGLRSEERQREMVKQGVSQTFHSKHLTGHAVDLAAYVGGTVTWEWSCYQKIAAAMKQAATELDVQITWGGDWISLKDGPHFELKV